MLAAALAPSRNVLACDEGADLATPAAAYGIGLVRNHPFSDAAFTQWVRDHAAR